MSSNRLHGVLTAGRQNRRAMCYVAIGVSIFIFFCYYVFSGTKAWGFLFLCVTCMLIQYRLFPYCWIGFKIFVSINSYFLMYWLVNRIYTLLFKVHWNFGVRFVVRFLIHKFLNWSLLCRSIQRFVSSLWIMINCIHLFFMITASNNW